MTGTLVYDLAKERLAIQAGVDTQHLHCGNCIDVLREVVTETSKSAWIPTRVEMSEGGEWYLVGMYKPGEIPYGMTVRTA